MTNNSAESNDLPTDSLNLYIVSLFEPILTAKPTFSAHIRKTVPWYHFRLGIRELWYNAFGDFMKVF
jgi:hypothetical protein